MSERTLPSNETKMSDGRRDRASMGAKGFASRQTRIAQGVAVRSIAWLALCVRSRDDISQILDQLFLHSGQLVVGEVKGLDKIVVLLSSESALPSLCHFPLNGEMAVERRDDLPIQKVANPLSALRIVLNLSVDHHDMAIHSRNPNIAASAGILPIDIRDLGLTRKGKYLRHQREEKERENTNDHRIGANETQDQRRLAGARVAASKRL